MELLASRKKHPSNTLIQVGNITFGDNNLIIIGGPCTIESQEQLFEIAKSVSFSGANILRGGAFKPRTSPYSFDGLGSQAIELLVQAGKKFSIPTISEIMDASHIPLFKDIDIIQVGAKNMQNFTLLKSLGKIDKPIMLKRGSGNTIEELLLSAEYILSSGNPNVILCERGIRTFEPMTRNTFDINAIPLLKQLTHLPVIADPSHGTGISTLVTPIALAAVAAGADGIMVEVHDKPEQALCDGAQAINTSLFKQMVIGAREYEKIRNKYI